MIVHITRFVFVVAGALGGLAISRLIDWSDQIGYPPYTVIFIFIILGLSIGYVLGGIFGRELAQTYRRAEKRLQEMASFDLVLGIAGLIIGLAIAWLASVPLRFIEPVWLSAFATVLLFLMLGSLGVRIAFIKKGDFARAMPGLSEVDAAYETEGLKILDTSAVI
ncbi:MAG: hypothetical protein IBX63_07475, partial [Coriobacteriia bacterium]|nr:hypothetical protein [Coriobacteriia bacterium]